MTPKLNRVLSEIRQLMEQEAWGPSLPPSSQSDFQDAKAGTGEANNEINIQDAIDFYLNNLCQALVDEFGIEENEAYDYVESAADEMEGDGMIPPMPSPDSSDSEAALWLGVVKSVGFEGYCLKLVRDQLSTKTSLRGGSRKGSEDMGMDMGMDDDLEGDME